MGREFSLVCSVGVALAVFFAGGYWLDQKFHAGFLWTTIGGCLGVFYMIWEIYKLIKDSNSK